MRTPCAGQQLFLCRQPHPTAPTLMCRTFYCINGGVGPLPVAGLEEQLEIGVLTAGPSLRSLEQVRRRRHCATRKLQAGGWVLSPKPPEAQAC